MQISSTGNFSSQSILKGKIYSANSVVKRLVDNTNLNEKQLEEEKNIGVKKTLETGIIEASSNMLLQVNDIDSLYSIDSDMHDILSLAQYATKDNLSDADRLRCQRAVDGYLNDIDGIGKQEDYDIKEKLAGEIKKYSNDSTAAVNAEATEDTADAKNTDNASASDSGLLNIMQEYQKIIKSKTKSWTETLGISGLNVMTAENAKKATQSTKTAAISVEREIAQLERDAKISEKIKNNNSSSVKAADTENKAVADSTSQSEYVSLLKTFMKSDAEQTFVSQTADGTQKKAGAVLDTVA